MWMNRQLWLFFTFCFLQTVKTTMWCLILMKVQLCFQHDFYSFYTQVLVNCLFSPLHSLPFMNPNVIRYVFEENFSQNDFLTEVRKFHSPQLQGEAKAMPSLSCRAPLLMHILQRWIPNVSASAFFFFFFDLYMCILLTAATYVNVCLCKKGMHTCLLVQWLQHELENYHISLRTPQGAWNESDKTFTHFLRDRAATLRSRFILIRSFTFTLLKG